MDFEDPDYEQQLAHLDPQLRARLEEWRTKQTLLQAQPLTEAEQAESRYDVPGTWRARHTRQVIGDFLTKGGWTISPSHGRTGRPVGRPTSYPDGMPQTEQERMRQEIGFTREDFKRLVPGTRRRLSKEELLQRLTLEQNIAAMIRRGHGQGIVRHLADAYDTSKGTISKLGARGRALADLLADLFGGETQSP